MLAPSYPCVTMRFPQGCFSLFILVPGDVFVIGTQLYIVLKPYKHNEVLILKMKLQYFGDLMGRTDSLEKTLMLGKI